jgi:cellulose synthase/poly-beta-1,6-N-acetylglucosamine synthase-like glycosyltransferase
MISFIVPAHNEEHELPQTLRAIRHAAGVSQQRYEIIVVDDVSTDATAEIAQQLGARVEAVNLRQIAAVRNAGARVARGEILFFVDADTRIAPGHVTAGVAALDEGCSGGSAKVALDGEVPFWARVFLRVFSTLYFASNLGVGAFMFTRRETFVAAGGFDEQYFAGEEMYLSRELKKLGPFTILAEPIITSARKVRMHSGAHVLRQWLGMMLRGEDALRKRDQLHLWYDGKREGKPA